MRIKPTEFEWVPGILFWDGLFRKRVVDVDYRAGTITLYPEWRGSGVYDVRDLPDEVRLCDDDPATYAIMAHRGLIS